MKRINASRCLVVCAVLALNLDRVEGQSNRNQTNFETKSVAGGKQSVADDGEAQMMREIGQRASKGELTDADKAWMEKLKKDANANVQASAAEMIASTERQIRQQRELVSSQEAMGISAASAQRLLLYLSDKLELEKQYQSAVASKNWDTAKAIQAKMQASTDKWRVSSQLASLDEKRVLYEKMAQESAPNMQPAYKEVLYLLDTLRKNMTALQTLDERGSEQTKRSEQISGLKSQLMQKELEIIQADDTSKISPPKAGSITPGTATSTNAK